MVVFDETHSLTIIDDEGLVTVTGALRLPEMVTTGVETTIGAVTLSVAVHAPSMQEKVGDGCVE